jgi:hypothetical protein
VIERGPVPCASNGLLVVCWRCGVDLVLLLAMACPVA